MIAFGVEIAHRFSAGDLILLNGPLGAGKTTLVRGVAKGLGWKGLVRSPTFNLIQTFPLQPPLMHADLYRVESADGLGLEEHLDDSITFVEWPGRLRGWGALAHAYRIEIEYCGDGRTCTIHSPEID